MTLNGVMAFILRNFTDFMYDVVVKQLLGLPRFQNLLLIVCDHINTICTTIQRLFGQNKRRQWPPLIASTSDFMSPGEFLVAMGTSIVLRSWLDRRVHLKLGLMGSVE